MKNFIHVHRWSNSIQDYQYVGHLLYENELTGGAVSFFYDRDYINAGGPSLEPRNLATNKNHGKHVVTAGNGVLPLYFQQFLPGAYGQVMLKNEFSHFERLNQFQKLSICAELFGDHIAIRLNAQNNQSNLSADSHTDLTKLTLAIQESKPDNLRSPIGSDKLSATCSLPGSRSKIEYTSTDDGQRYVLKPNASSQFNESQVRHFVHLMEAKAGIDSAPIKMLSLHEGGIEVALQKNFKHHFEMADDNALLLKFNSVSFDVLHGENSLLSPSPAFSYKDAAAIVDTYSVSPQEDKEQLLLRALFSAAINHTTNGLDNLNLVDLGSNHWRLAPAYNTLPNPLQESTFALRFSDHQVSRMHFDINDSFAVDLALSMNLQPESGNSALDKVNTALANRHELYEQANIDSSTQSVIELAIGSGKGIYTYSHPQDTEQLSPGMR
ncbi:HipA domain-containing protein [Salinimonas sp. HHU 13199]|uniref:HipA domain-containing protein n=1 Tax=Salinimonas profundi TaxID=2729140 RepID=A0ABR8LS26_9ALTE|nr:HipA domain-containing protein [Salinimonas profundi]MBD3587232.1 HipA domain-containing protein [Salinimonas profundi]